MYIGRVSQTENIRRQPGRLFHDRQYMVHTSFSYFEIMNIRANKRNGLLSALLRLRVGSHGGVVPDGLAQSDRDHRARSAGAGQRLPLDHFGRSRPEQVPRPDEYVAQHDALGIEDIKQQGQTAAQVAGADLEDPAGQGISLTQDSVWIRCTYQPDPPRHEKPSLSAKVPRPCATLGRYEGFYFLPISRLS